MSRVTMKSFASAISMLILFAAFPVFAAQTMVLKLDGIRGESTKAGHESEIDVLSWDWGAEMTTSTRVGRGAGAGSSKSYDLTITKWVDAASPLLYQAVMQGKQIREAVFVVATSTSRRETAYITIKLKNVMVTSVKTNQSNSNDRPKEQITLSFDSAEYTYTPIKADGSAGSAITVKW